MDTSRISRAGDLASRPYQFSFSKFLSPKEQLDFFDEIRFSHPDELPRLFFYGGALGCERRKAIFVPDYLQPDSGRNFEIFSSEREKEFVFLVRDFEKKEYCGINAVCATGSGFEIFGHRDVLGSVLALGLEREMIGDIAITGGSSAIIFACDTVAGYIADNLSRVGRDSIRCSVADGNIDLPQREFVILDVTVSSFRADCIVASITGTGRSRAKELIEGGAVFLNYSEITDSDKKISEGDTVSVRGFGKYIIDAFSGQTKKGRLKAKIKKYI